jgi:hypothetical protein
MAYWKSWWWVAAFCSVIGIVCLQSMKGKRIALSEYSFRLEEMEKQKRLACVEREELRLRIASQADPAWIEMILMRELGVVPEGWLKVHFKK